MTSTTHPRGMTTLLRGQVLAAIWLPWLLVVLGPGLAPVVAVAFLGACVAFAAWQPSVRARWAIPVSTALTLLVPAISWGTPRAAWTITATVVALAVSLLATTRGQAMRSSASRTAPARLVAVVGLTALGLVAGATAAYSSVAEDRRYSDAQAAASNEWPSSDGLRAKPKYGAAVARLSFERSDGSRPIAGDIYVFAGTDDAALAKGPGWYRSTSAPGARGNTAIAGHRTGHGSPFADLDRLRVGDIVTMTTPGDAVRSYRIVDVLTVAPDDVWVLGPDPRGDGSTLLTLTTCDPPNVNSERLVVQAELVSGSSPA